MIFGFPIFSMVGMSAHKKTGANSDPSSMFSLTLFGDFARTTRRCKSDLTQANRLASIDSRRADDSMPSLSIGGTAGCSYYGFASEWRACVGELRTVNMSCTAAVGCSADGSFLNRRNCCSLGGN